MRATYDFIMVPEKETLLAKIWWRFLKGCDPTDGETIKQMFEGRWSNLDLDDKQLYYIDVNVF